MQGNLLFLPKERHLSQPNPRVLASTSALQLLPNKMLLYHHK